MLPLSEAFSPFGPKDETMLEVPSDVKLDALS